MMNKMMEFYRNVLTDEAARAELSRILGETEISCADDIQLEQIGELARRLGYDMDLEEVKRYLRADEQELSDEDLDAVAGGKGDTRITCNVSGGYVNPGGGPVPDRVTCDSSGGNISA